MYRRNFLSVKVLVEKQKNRVVFLESDKYFLDVLCSFMTMPLATIIRLTREHLLKKEIGCLSSLYESVENLNEDYLQNTDHIDVLLNPRCAAEIYYDNLKVRLLGSIATDYYACESEDCDFLSCYQSTNCRCGSSLTLELDVSDSEFIPGEREGFVKPPACFMISDDFQVMPMSTKSGLALLEKVSRLEGSEIEERTINIGRDEVLKLLKQSFVSRTPFSDIFMEPPISKACYNVPHVKYGPGRKTEIPRIIDPKDRISIKLIVNKSKNKAIYAEAKEDFVRLLCSFLAFPLGYAFSEFPSLSFKGCIGNFYKTIKDFDTEQFITEEMKEAIVNPKLAPGLPVTNQLIGIMEAVDPSYSTLNSLFTVMSYSLESISNISEQAGDCEGSNISEQAEGCEGCKKGPSIFMVTDNLIITPLSAISGISLINKLKIPLPDIEEWQVTIGEDEALRLLVATLVSRCALTVAFLQNELKQES